MTRASVVFASPRTIEVRDEARPRPGAGQVLVAARMSGISAGTEMLVYRGQAPAGMSLDAALPSLAGDAVYPLKYGYSMVGRVIETGPGVDDAWHGRSVFAFQPHESHFVAAISDLVVLPDDMPAENAIFLPNMETAINFVQDGRPMIGERVAVFGQGIVGLLTTALLRRFPLQRLLTVDPLAVRRSLSLQWGAHESVAPANVQGAFDLTYEVSGNPHTLNGALAATAFSGRVVIGSWYGEKRAPIDLGGDFHRSRIRIMSSQVSTIDPSIAGAWDKKRRLELALALLQEVQPAALVTHRFAVQDAARAYALLDEACGDALQVALTYD